MKFAAILPHTKLYGGVKRFYELGNALHSLGHEFYVLTPDGKSPDWYAGSVTTMELEKLKEYEWATVFITELQYLPELLSATATLKVFYFVRASDKIGILKKHPGITVFANSTNVLEVAKKKFGIEAYPAFGGVNTRSFQPKELEPKGEEPIVIMMYGRLVERKKGTRLVVRACERLYRKGFNIRLLLFDTPVNEKARQVITNFNSTVPFEFIVDHPVSDNLSLYHKADIFVAAEKNAGISNTSAEAMASGIPVIATESGTRDFLVHMETGLIVSRWSWTIAKAIKLLINDFELRKRLAKKGRTAIEQLSWDNLAFNILDHPNLRSSEK